MTNIRWIMDNSNSQTFVNNRKDTNLKLGSVLIVLPSVTDHQHIVKLENPSPKPPACADRSRKSPHGGPLCGEIQVSRSHGPLGVSAGKSSSLKGTWDSSQGNSKATLPPVYSFKKTRDGNEFRSNLEIIWMELYRWFTVVGDGSPTSTKKEWYQKDGWGFYPGLFYQVTPNCTDL